METLKYDEARELIQDGDIINFRRTARTNPLACLTTLVTRTPYFHSGLAVWLKSEHGQNRLFVVEAHSGGRRIVPLSHYSLSNFDVIACPFDFQAISDFVLERIAKVRYGYLDFIGIGIKELFKIPVKDSATGEVCSEFVAKAWMAAGVNIPDTLLSPGKLNKYLTETLGLPYRCQVRF